MKQKLSILMVPVMAVYTLLPCVSQAVSISSPFLNKTHLVHSVQQSAIPPTDTITYFYNGSTLINAEDDNGDMSTYLDRTVRTIVNVNTQTVEDTQCLFTDGKNVISQTDSTGTNVTSTQQYNAFGQPVSYTSSTNKQINKLTNQQLNILTNPFQYDGYYNDSESGLYYLNARYYSPTLMQFISMDTYDLANRYAYSDGNPIGNEDPTGHSVMSVLNSISYILNFGFVAGGISKIMKAAGAGNKAIEITGMTIATVLAIAQTWYGLGGLKILSAVKDASTINKIARVGAGLDALSGGGQLVNTFGNQIYGGKATQYVGAALDVLNVAAIGTNLCSIHYQLYTTSKIGRQPDFGSNLKGKNGFLDLEQKNLKARFTMEKAKNLESEDLNISNNKDLNISNNEASILNKSINDSLNTILKKQVIVKQLILQ